MTNGRHRGVARWSQPYRPLVGIKSVPIPAPSAARDRRARPRYSADSVPNSARGGAPPGVLFVRARASSHSPSHRPSRTPCTARSRTIAADKKSMISGARSPPSSPSSPERPTRPRQEGARASALASSAIDVHLHDHEAEGFGAQRPSRHDPAVLRVGLQAPLARGPSSRSSMPKRARRARGARWWPPSSASRSTRRAPPLVDVRIVARSPRLLHAASCRCGRDGPRGDGGVEMAISVSTRFAADIMVESARTLLGQKGSTINAIRSQQRRVLDVQKPPASERREAPGTGSGDSQSVLLRGNAASGGALSLEAVPAQGGDVARRRAGARAAAAPHPPPSRRYLHGPDPRGPPRRPRGRRPP